MSKTNRIKELSAAYDSGNPLVTDEEFDRIAEEWQLETGESILPEADDERRVPLPYWLGSLDKVHTIAELTKWLKRRKYTGKLLCQPKYDGITGLYCCTKGTPKLYTKGNRRGGLDISHFLPLMQLPISSHDVRGEIIISKEVMSQHFKDSSDFNYIDGRSAVSGLSNRLESTGMEKYFTFIAFEIMDERLDIAKEREILNSEGFTTAPITEIALTEDSITEQLQLSRNINYSCDGLVISVPKKRDYHPDKNPKRSVAFKVRGTPTPTVVTEIEWKPSRRALYIPTVHFKTVELKDASTGKSVKISKATGHNASQLIESGIGVGAEIGVIRSGDVIPFIMDVYKTSDEFNIPVDATWISEVNLGCSPDNKTVLVKKLSRQFELLGVDKIRESKCSKLLELGVIDIFDIYRIEVSSVLSREQLNSIESKLQSIEEHKLMNMSGLFDTMSNSLLKSLLEGIPDIIELSTSTPLDRSQWINLVTSVEGFGLHRAEIIADNIDTFSDWYCLNSEYFSLKSGTAGSNSDFEGEVVCFTGFTNSELEDTISQRGGTVVPRMTKKVTLLVHKEGSEDTIKYKTAVKYGIDIMSEAEFKLYYSL